MTFGIWTLPGLLTEWFALLTDVAKFPSTNIRRLCVVRSEGHLQTAACVKLYRQERIGTKRIKRTTRVATEYTETEILTPHGSDMYM